MKLNRSALLVLALVLSVAMITTGTLAYLTDTESKVNVFTIGNVDISVEEPSWEDGSTLLPGVPVEKDPYIENKGETDAWTWMTVAIPTPLYPHLELNYSSDWVLDDEVDTTSEPGYTIVTLLYPELLATGEKTPEAFTTVTLKDYVDADADGNLLDADGNQIGWNVADKPDLTVTGYAIQDKPFEDVEEAYDAYTHTGSYAPTVEAGTADDVSNALASGNSINLTEDVSTTSPAIDDDAVVNIDLQDHTLDTSLVNNGELNVENGKLTSTGAALENYGDAELSDVVVEAGSPTDYALISKADSTTVYENVDITSAGGGIGAVDGASVTFESGSLAVNTTSTSGRYLFYAEGAGTEITINDGDFSFSKTLNQKRAYIYAGDGTTVYVNGGNFGPASTRSGYTAGILTNGTGKVVITGGTFGFDPSAWVAEGYVATKSGTTWTVTAE